MELTIGKISDIVAFSRPSGGSYFDASGVLRWAGNDEWRRDHDPITREPLGILIEEQRTNLVPRSQELDIWWNTEDLTVTPNVLAAPDGTITADNISVDIGGTINSGLAQFLVVVPVDAVSSYTGSVFLKKGSSDRAVLNVLTGGGTFQQELAEVHWNADGSIASVVNGFYAPTGGGWYRVWTSPLKNNGTNEHIALRLYPHDIHSPTAGQDVYAWGAQLEVGAFPTSYIPTAGAQATRAADAASVQGNGWLAQNVGTLIVEGSRPAAGGVGWPGLASIYAVSLAGSIGTFQDEETRGMAVIIQEGSLNVFTSHVPGPALGETIKIGIAFSPTSVVAASNTGGLGHTVEGVSIPPLDVLLVGNTYGWRWNGHVKRITYFPRRLSNAELQEITT